MSKLFEQPSRSPRREGERPADKERLISFGRHLEELDRQIESQEQQLESCHLLLKETNSRAVREMIDVVTKLIYLNKTLRRKFIAQKEPEEIHARQVLEANAEVLKVVHEHVIANLSPDQSASKPTRKAGDDTVHEFIPTKQTDRDMGGEPLANRVIDRVTQVEIDQAVHAKTEGPAAEESFEALETQILVLNDHLHQLTDEYLEESVAA